MPDLLESQQKPAHSGARLGRALWSYPRAMRARPGRLSGAKPGAAVKEAIREWL